ncbi:MAG: choice-of-anchor D domain-containing protein [Verrucomicrobiota bacterium]
MTRVLSAALAILLVPTSPLLAETIGYTLSGVTTANVSTGPALPAEFPVGTPFTATVQWESTSAPLFESSTQGQFRLTQFTLTFSGKSGKWTTSALPDKPSFTLNDFGSGNELQFTSGWGPENHSNPTIADLAPYSANLVLLDPTGTAIPSLGSAPSSLNLADWDLGTSYLKLYLNNAGSAYVSGKFLSSRSLFAPEISIKLPNGKPAVDGKSAQKFGTSSIGKKSKAQKFVIRNTCPVAIQGLKVATTGKSGKDFLLGKLSATTLAPGSSATVKVSFKPKAKGKRTAVLRISHSESGKNPFDIALIGKGKKP